MNKNLRTLLAVLLALCLVLGLAACKAKAPVEESAAPSEEPTAPVVENPTIRLSTTTSVNDSGLLPYLQPVFEADTGYKLEISSAGTGAAIEKGRTGDADALLVHAKASEEEFISQGYADERIPFMYNYFVIVGPKDDPAGVKSCANASEAFKKLQRVNTPSSPAGTIPAHIRQS